MLTFLWAAISIFYFLFLHPLFFSLRFCWENFRLTYLNNYWIMRFKKKKSLDTVFEIRYNKFCSGNNLKQTIFISINKDDNH